MVPIWRAVQYLLQLQTLHLRRHLQFNHTYPGAYRLHHLKRVHVGIRVLPETDGPLGGQHKYRIDDILARRGN